MKIGLKLIKVGISFKNFSFLKQQETIIEEKKMLSFVFIIDFSTLYYKYMSINFKFFLFLDLLFLK